MARIAEVLRDIIEKKERISIRRVAKAIGVDHGSLYRALKDGGNPEANTIEKVLDYLGYEIQVAGKYDKKSQKPRPSSGHRRRKNLDHACN